MFSVKFVCRISCNRYSEQVAIKKHYFESECAKLCLFMIHLQEFEIILILFDDLYTIEGF